MDKPNIKKNLSEPQLKAELTMLFESGNTDKGNLWELFSTKYKIQKQRFYKCINTALQEWKEVKQKATNEQIQANTVDGLKSAYMGKQERLEYLDKIIKGEIEITQKKPFFNLIEKKMQFISVSNTADFTERLKAVAEMNKMQGDYTPTKIEHSGALKIGKDLADELYTD